MLLCDMIFPEPIVILELWEVYIIILITRSCVNATSLCFAAWCQHFKDFHSRCYIEVFAADFSSLYWLACMDVVLPSVVWCRNLSINCDLYRAAVVGLYWFNQDAIFITIACSYFLQLIPITTQISVSNVLLVVEACLLIKCQTFDPTPVWLSVS